MKREDRVFLLAFKGLDHQSAHHDAAYELLPPDLDGKTILDVGCGHGDFLYKLPQSTKDHYLGIDLNAKAIEIAREEWPGWKFKHTKRVTPADIIVALAITSEGVHPRTLIRSIWKNAGEAAVFTIWRGFGPIEKVAQWCPKPPDVMLASHDFFAGALYK